MAKNLVVLQQDQSDCGNACLATVIKYYQGEVPLEQIRILSGTNKTGTTLLGLFHAALKLGFDAEGCEATIDGLIQHKSPLILHVIPEPHLQHYVVCFGTVREGNSLSFVVGDPGKGIIHLSADELDAIWQSKRCLTLQPNVKFKKKEETDKAKRSWVLAMIKADIPILSISAGLGVAISILSLVMAIFSQRLIDDIIPHRLYSKLYLNIAFVFFLLLIKEGLNIVRQFFLQKQARAFNIRISDIFYNHLLRLPKTFFDTRKIGDLTARLNDSTRIQKVISQIAGNIVIDVLITLVVFIFLFIYSWIIALAALILLPVYFMLIYKNADAVMSAQKNIMQSYATSEANYISTLQGIEPIKNHNKEPLFSGLNKKLYERFYEHIFKLGNIQIRLSFLANCFGIIFLLTVLSFASYQVLNQHLRMGQLIAITGMCSTLLPSVANLALVTIPLSEAKVAFDRMFEFTEIDTEKDTEELPSFLEWNKLSARGISFRYAGRPLLLKTITFNVSKGEIIALMGENGCGKTTITQIIQKTLQKESGHIHVNNTIDLETIGIMEWRKIVGIVPQNIHVFNGTVLENIAFEEADTKKQEVLKFLFEYGFAPLIDLLPQSYMTLVGEEGINLSGGQKQIIAIARALYHKPQLLILDEATAAMDRQTELFILNLLKTINPKMGIIFITHRLHILKSFCDRIYVLDDGIVTHEGNHEALLQSENLYNSYWSDLN